MYYFIFEIDKRIFVVILYLNKCSSIVDDDYNDSRELYFIVEYLSAHVDHPLPL